MSDEEYGVVPPQRTDTKIEEGAFTDVVLPVAGAAFGAGSLGVAAAAFGSARRTEDMTRQMNERDAIRFRQDQEDRQARTDEWDFPRY